MHTNLAGFEWDRANWSKCQKHGLTIKTIEGLFHGPLTVFLDHVHSGREKRFNAIGTTEDKRNIFVVFTLRNHGGNAYIRVISARYMHKKEVKFYEKKEAEKIANI